MGFGGFAMVCRSVCFGTKLGVGFGQSTNFHPTVLFLLMNEESQTELDRASCFLLSNSRSHFRRTKLQVMLRQRGHLCDAAEYSPSALKLECVSHGACQFAMGDFLHPEVNELLTMPSEGCLPALQLGEFPERFLRVCFVFATSFKSFPSSSVFNFQQKSKGRASPRRKVSRGVEMKEIDLECDALRAVQRKLLDILSLKDWLRGGTVEHFFNFFGQNPFEESYTI